jgi:hypothetical protein
MKRTAVLATLLVTATTAAPSCSAAPQPDATFPEASIGEARAFWDGLQPLCGNAYAGTPVHVPDADTAFRTQRLVMQVASCTASEIRIPLYVGTDRSRTWVLRRVGTDLELKHIHRHEDGTLSSNTDYGGTTTARGTAHRQEFPADSFSVAAVPGRASQWWFLEHYPGHLFAYGLFRKESGLLYRIEFNLTEPVAALPPPW